MNCLNLRGPTQPPNGDSVWFRPQPLGVVQYPLLYGDIAKNKVPAGAGTGIDAPAYFRAVWASSGWCEKMCPHQRGHRDLVRGRGIEPRYQSQVENRLRLGFTNKRTSQLNITAEFQRSN
jgi:hypothetical protein